MMKKFRKSHNQKSQRISDTQRKSKRIATAKVRKYTLIKRLAKRPVPSTECEVIKNSMEQTKFSS